MSNHQEFCFIGGPTSLDGTWRQVKVSHMGPPAKVDLPLANPVAQGMSPEGELVDLHPRTHTTYTYERLVLSPRTTVYALKGLTPEDVFELLVKHYL